MKDRLQFSRLQLEELKRLGVIPEQVAELLRVLPVCKASLGVTAPRMADVRDELQSMEKGIGRALALARRWERAGHTSLARLEARWRVAEEASSLDPGNDALVDARVALELLSLSVQKASANLPAQERRKRAPMWAIRWIDAALVRGWGSAHYRVRHGDEQVDSTGSRPPPAFPHVASSGITSSFRRIVGICFEVIADGESNDPERAIKAFLRWRKEQTSLGRQGLAVPSLAS